MKTNLIPTTITTTVKKRKKNMTNTSGLRP